MMTARLRAAAAMGVALCLTSGALEAQAAPVIPHNVSRRSLVKGVAAGLLTPSMTGSDCVTLLQPAPAKMARAADLIQAVVNQRYENVLLTGAQAVLQRPHQYYLFRQDVNLPWDPKRRAVHADDQFWVTTNIEHPLRNTLTRVFGTSYPDSTRPADPKRFNGNFQRGDLPSWVLAKLRSWALSISTVQARLSERLGISIDQIESEMPYIYEPRRNEAYWLVDDAGGPADPFPISLGLDFHRAFYAELKGLEPDLAAELEEQENREMRHETLTGRDHRFSATGPLGAYLNKTGKRMTLKVSEYGALRSHLAAQARAYEKANPNRDDVNRDQTAADRIFGNGDLSVLQLREFLKWIGKVRTTTTIVTATVPSTSSGPETAPALLLPDKLEQIPIVQPIASEAKDLRMELEAERSQHP